MSEQFGIERSPQRGTEQASLIATSIFVHLRCTRIVGQDRVECCTRRLALLCLIQAPDR